MTELNPCANCGFGLTENGRCSECGFSSDNKFKLTPEDLRKGYRRYLNEISLDEGYDITETGDYCAFCRAELLFDHPLWSGEYHIDGLPTLNIQIRNTRPCEGCGRMIADLDNGANLGELDDLCASCRAERRKDG